VCGTRCKKKEERVFILIERAALETMDMAAWGRTIYVEKVKRLLRGSGV
jgi:hypothetical protein